MTTLVNRLLTSSLCCLTVTLGACREMPSTPPANSGGIHVPSAAEAGAGNQQDAQFIAMLAELNRKNPEQDAQAAIAQGKRHFLCNAGRSATVPGLTAEVFATVRDRCPTECLEGVSDGLYGPNHARYVSAALNYSARWNQVMLVACR